MAKILKPAIGVLALVLTAWLCWHFGSRAFHRWESNRLVGVAENYLRKGDLRSASLSAGQALQNNPFNPQAMEVMASIADTSRSPAAVLWRQRATDLQPGNVQALLSLASTALSYRESFIASGALEQIPESERHTSTYHQIAGGLALSEGDFENAEIHFSEVLHLTPSDKLAQFNLSAIRLRASDTNLVESARRELEKLATDKDPELRQQAWRALLADARKRNDPQHARQWAQNLENSPAATINDHLLYLEELKHDNDPAFAPKLLQLQQDIQDQPAPVFAVLSWMNMHGMAPQSMEWCSRLPPTTLSQNPVPMAEAQSYAMCDAWKELRPRLNASSWGPLDFLRIGIQAQIIDKLSTLGGDHASDLKWNQAIRMTGGNPNALSMLANLASNYGWQEKAREIWWIIAEAPAGQQYALRRLYRDYTTEKNTEQLYRLACRIREIQPNNPVARNNEAYFALLLGRDQEQACRLAAANYQEHPGEPIIASTQALALHAEGKDSEALKILERLPKELLLQPSMAATYGTVLARTGHGKEALGFLNHALQHQGELLPEEMSMATQSLDTLK